VPSAQRAIPPLPFASADQQDDGLLQLLEHLGYRPQLVVVEFNGTILPRQRWPEQPVREADGLEVVTIVGGGS